MLLLDCMANLLLMVIMGVATSVLSALIVIYVIIKVMGIETILDMEDEEDYILTKDDEKIPYDDETQE